MMLRTRYYWISVLLWAHIALYAQDSDSVHTVTGVLYDVSFHPVPASHVVNLRTHQGVITDSLGIFSIPAAPNDTILFRNIAFHDTLIAAGSLPGSGYVILRRRYYPLQEARIFQWGSTYEDFKEAITHMPSVQTFGESMGLPTQDPDYIPLEMNEQTVKSLGHLIHSPISYFYYNFNKKAKSARRLFWMEKNSEKQEIFDEITSPENLSSVTGLTGQPLQEFIFFLYQRMACDFKCTELQIYSEIYSLWEVYRAMSGQ